MTQASGFFPRIQALTSKISEYHGYWIANEYDGWGAKAEYLACRERVAMIDLSALRKFEITGPDAEAFMQYALTRNIRCGSMDGLEHRRELASRIDVS